jgi:hypothetical protein
MVQDVLFFRYAVLCPGCDILSGDDLANLFLVVWLFWWWNSFWLLSCIGEHSVVESQKLFDAV